jgi:hypothetical protein
MQKSILNSFLMTLAVLCIPLVAMQFTAEVNWDRSDFIIIGTLVFITSIAFKFAMKKITTHSHRILAGGIIILGFIYVWAELAVGIFTNLGS